MTRKVFGCWVAKSWVESAIALWIREQDDDDGGGVGGVGGGGGGGGKDADGIAMLLQEMRGMKEEFRHEMAHVKFYQSELQV